MWKARSDLKLNESEIVKIASLGRPTKARRSDGQSCKFKSVSLATHKNYWELTANWITGTVRVPSASLSYVLGICVD